MWLILLQPDYSNHIIFKLTGEHYICSLLLPTDPQNCCFHRIFAYSNPLRQGELLTIPSYITPDIRRDYYSYNCRNCIRGLRKFAAITSLGRDSFRPPENSHSIQKFIGKRKSTEKLLHIYSRWLMLNDGMASNFRKNSGCNN